MSTLEWYLWLLLIAVIIFSSCYSCMHRAEVSSTVSMPPAVIDKEAIQQMEKE